MDIAKKQLEETQTARAQKQQDLEAIQTLKTQLSAADAKLTELTGASQQLTILQSTNQQLNHDKAQLLATIVELQQTIEELSQIFELLDRNPRVKFCIDTAHAFASGYDIKTKSRPVFMSAGMFVTAHLNISFCGDDQQSLL